MGAHFRTLVEGAFLLPKSSLSKQDQAHTILQTLFSELVPGTKLPQIESKKEQKAFLSCILYHIFALNFPLEHLRSKLQLEGYLFSILASTCSNKTILKIWNSLSFTTKIKTAAFCSYFYDEGSFRLFQNCKNEMSALYNKLAGGLITAKDLWHWAQNKKSITQKDLTLFLEEQDHILKHKTAQFKKAAETLFLPLTFSDDLIRKFISIFGLYGHQVPLKTPSLADFEGLDDKLVAIIQYLKEPEKDAEIEKALHLFCQRVLAHLKALSHPEVYIEGLQHIVYTIPTCGRDLKNEPSLESFLEGFKRFSDHDFVIFIFDQSTVAQYKKNARYIKSLEKRYTTHIEHLDKSTLIHLAKEHGLEELIVTGPEKRFGYAGVRNALLLLGPIVHRRFYNKDLTPCIMISDDDVYNPACNLFSDALFAKEHLNSYFSRFGSYIGRITTTVYASMDFLECLTRSNKILSQCAWSQSPIPHCMSPLLSSPKLCLNIPLGQEENHFWALNNYDFDFRKPALHLAGWRYPKGILPTNRFSGLAAYLQPLNAYVWGLSLVTELLDPSNLSNKCALVWNLVSKPYSCLTEAIDNILQPETIQAMQKQFWQNYRDFLKGFSESSGSHPGHLVQQLIDSDLDKVLHEYCALNPDTHFYKKELLELQCFFQTMKQEALWLKEFAFAIETLECIEKAKDLVERSSKKNIEALYFVYPLYVLCKSVGACGFQNAVRKMQ